MKQLLLGTLVVVLVYVTLSPSDTTAASFKLSTRTVEEYKKFVEIVKAMNDAQKLTNVLLSATPFLSLADGLSPVDLVEISQVTWGLLGTAASGLAAKNRAELRLFCKLEALTQLNSPADRKFWQALEKEFFIKPKRNPSAYRVPTISEISGELSHGNQLEIRGSGFGTKVQAPPLVWDDVEQGKFHDDWGNSGSIKVSAVSRHMNSSYCGTCNFQGKFGDRRKGCFAANDDILSESWFCQYWFKLDENWEWGTAVYGILGANLANVKIFRMRNPGSIDENFVISTHGYSGDRVRYNAEYVGGHRSGYFTNVNNWTKGVWHCFQFEYMDSSVGGNDGAIRVWLDGEQVLNDTGIMTREDFSELKRPCILGFYNSWGDRSTNQNDFFIDDAYIDNTWARVEIGDNASYNACIHREIQVPLAWSSESIAVSFNAGSFDTNESLYLFVVNDRGMVSEGFIMGYLFDGARGSGSPLKLRSE